eukprot:scaffold210545_cov37-Prasinocladus_malaysianus.AAC.1
MVETKGQSACYSKNLSPPTQADPLSSASIYHTPFNNELLIKAACRAQLMACRQRARDAGGEHRQRMKEASDAMQRLSDIEAAQEAAAEAEDFDKAADLGDELAAVQGSLAEIQRAAAAAECAAEEARNEATKQ